MRPQDFWERLPKFDELLEHPKVVDAVDRWKQSAAVARVRTAIEDLGAEASRRAEQWRGVSPGEVIDRLVRKIDRPRWSAPPRVVNATGELWGGPAGGPPLSAAALQSLSDIATGYHTVGGDNAESGALAARMTGAESGWLGVSQATAITTLLDRVRGECGVVIARSDVSEIEPGLGLAHLLERSGVQVCEVGAAEGATLDDYRTGVQSIRDAGVARPIVLRRLAERHEVVGGIQRVDSVELARLAHEASGLFVEDLGGAPLLPPACDLGADIPCAATTLTEGADIVLVRGDGLIGGPQGCLVLGSREVIGGFPSGPGSLSAVPSPLVDVLMAASLRLHETPERLPFVHPLYELLDTPLENLRTRAERLAARIDATDSYSAEALLHEASAASRPRGLVRLATWCVAVTPHKATPEQTAERLVQNTTPILCRQNAARLEFDLRTVFTSQDADLIQALIPRADSELG